MIVNTPVPFEFTLKSPDQLKTMAKVLPVFVSVVAIVLPVSVPLLEGVQVVTGGIPVVVQESRPAVAVKTPTRRMSCRGAVARPEPPTPEVWLELSEEKLFTGPIRKA